LPANKKEIAIIGNGCAAAECIKALRENGYNGEIHIFTDSRWPIYNPMLTTYYVSGKIDFDQLFPYGKEQFYKKYNVHLHPGSPVVELDHDKRMVVNSNGLKLNYDQCLIASGASPFLPPIEGIDSSRVYTMRNVDDAVRLKETLREKPRKAIVIGASMIGIKIAELFYQQGLEVCLADLAKHIFPLAAHPECARVIEKRLIEKGIKLRLGAAIKKIVETEQGIEAYFKNSSENEKADLLVICIGVRANISFVDQEKVEVKQGILIDNQMRTNLPGLYAAGDVAQGRNILSGEHEIIGLWANARYQGRTAGRNMAGKKETFPGNIPHNITHFMGMDFIGIGDIYHYDKTEKKYDNKTFIQLFWKDRLLTGANFLDTYTKAGALKYALANRSITSTKDCSYPLPVIHDMLIKEILTEVKQRERYSASAQKQNSCS
jgi:NAD(P)H-nitrite reductase large subunit